MSGRLWLSNMVHLWTMKPTATDRFYLNDLGGSGHSTAYEIEKNAKSQWLRSSSEHQSEGVCVVYCCCVKVRTPDVGGARSRNCKGAFRRQSYERPRAYYGDHQCRLSCENDAVGLTHVKQVDFRIRVFAHDATSIDRYLSAVQSSVVGDDADRCMSIFL